MTSCVATDFGVAFGVECSLLKKAREAYCRISLKRSRFLCSFTGRIGRLIVATGVGAFCSSCGDISASRARIMDSVKYRSSASHGERAREDDDGDGHLHDPHVCAPARRGGITFLARQDFGVFFDWAAGFVNNFYPNVTLNGSFGSSRTGGRDVELKNNPTFRSLPGRRQRPTVVQIRRRRSSRTAFRRRPRCQSLPAIPRATRFTTVSSGF